ncbi:hypothetical protein TruAng_012329 [Truncatella angustata]|nr:hypothetical protein TruAng_012329 [Truncatella angustata]
MGSPTPLGTPSSPTSSVASTPTPLNREPESFPDYSIWTPDRFAAFPGLGLYHEPKKELKWWWKYGFRLKDPKRPLKLQQIWVCEACLLVKKKTAFVASGSRSIEKHLKENHRVVEKGKNAPTSTPSSQRTLDSMVDFSQPQQQALHGQLAIRFNKALNNLLILDWLCCSNLPFRIVDNPRWRRQQLYNNPILTEQDLPHSKTIVRLLLAEYKRAVPQIKSFLRTARSQIHLTFDGWTSRKFILFIGVHAHFVDKDFRKWTILLGLPALVKRHTGSDVADEVLAVIRFFEIEDLVGYCTLDNESKNKATMVKIGEELGFDGVERQISCAPHALQLAVRALLYGDGCKRLPLDQVLETWLQEEFADERQENDALERAFGAVAVNLEGEEEQEEEDDDNLNQQDSTSEDDTGSDFSDTGNSSDCSESDGEDETGVSEAEVEALSSAFDYLTPNQITTKTMAKYNKNGPFGKLHNHGNCFHRSSQLVGALRQIQRDLDPQATVKEWIQNNATRWQSDEAMAARALELKQVINRLHQSLTDHWEGAGSKQGDKPPILEFRLGPQDWRVVEAIQKILQPFKVASKKLQGNGPAGALDQYFPQMEYLLLHLEDCAAGNCYSERIDPENPAGDPIPENVKLFANLSNQQRRFLKAYIKVGLWKLQHYYDKLVNLAYAAAVVFNPNMKMAGLQGIFDAEPQRQQQSWRDHYLGQLRTRWTENYKTRPSSSSDAPTPANQQPVLTMLRRRKRFYQADAASEVPDSQGTQDTQQTAKRRKGKKATPIRREDTPDDELEQYLAAPINDLSAYFDDPRG